MSLLRRLWPRTFSEGLIAITPGLIALATVLVLLLNAGPRGFGGATGLALVLATASLWIKERRDVARHQALTRRLDTIQRKSTAADEHTAKELSRISYYTTSGPHVKTTVGNIRDDIRGARETLERMTHALQSDEFQSAANADRCGTSPSTPAPLRAPSLNKATQPAKSTSADRTSGRLAAAVTADPLRGDRLSALITDAAEFTAGPPLVQAIALPATLRKLEEQYTVQNLRPESIRLNDQTSVFIIEQVALHQGIWYGTLHASRARQYRELRELLLAARRRSVLILYIDGPAPPWHFDNEIKARADIVITRTQVPEPTPWAPDKNLDIVSILAK